MRAQTLAQAPFSPLVGEFDRGLEALDRFLRSERSPPDSMMLSELDGFLTGLAVGPEFVPPSEWLPLVWGGDAPAAAGLGETAAMVGSVMARYDEILGEIADDALAPVFYKDRDGMIVAADWAEGFLQAIKLRADAWNPLFTSPRGGSLLVPILWPCRDESGRALLGLAPAQDDPLTEWTTELIPPCVKAIAAFWRRGGPRSIATVYAPGFGGEPYRAGEKIGRNARCPCGSGKKFKRCCGRAG